MTPLQELARIVNRAKVDVGSDTVSMRCGDAADAARALDLLVALGRPDPYWVRDTRVVTWATKAAA
jgi:hypothetical protein